VMNRRVCEVKGRTLMTFCFSVLDVADSTLTFGSAGHPFPYHYCAATQTLVPWELEGSFPLGVRQDTDYPVCSRSLAEEDVLVYYSDGLIEGDNEASELFGFERLESAIISHARYTSSDIKQGILDEFSAHCQQHEQDDDITLIVIKLSKAP
jgi:sigma-B regulation protein RsbU (phosphoserine phosphatase)